MAKTAEELIDFSKGARNVQEISNGIPEYKVSKMPLFPHKIKGIANLTNISEIMYGKAKK